MNEYAMCIVYAFYMLVFRTIEKKNPIFLFNHLLITIMNTKMCRSGKNIKIIKELFYNAYTYIEFGF